ncbi:Protein FAM5C [Willisornis vidua]|uniref:Protein FAM5C n=1 Tax=Willisornis vidua TaxID=1566151 RepID=A0ABQ9D3C9_9PASS|nr:Protein FAM5C [Willisornis vidua]
MIWRCSAGAELLSLMALWEWIALSLHCWGLAVAAVSDQHVTSPFDWLLSDKGPFHRSQEYTDFVDRSRQGFSTRYKIYSTGEMFSQSFAKGVTSNGVVKDMGMKRRVQSNRSDLMANGQKGRNETPGEIKD